MASGIIRSMKSIAIAENPHLGFQIAPMIDVVFVIMLFFMVMAGAVKTERFLDSRLPGGGVRLADAPLAEEVAVTIDEDGAVALNGEVLDALSSKSMPEFTRSFALLKQSMGGSADRILVTIEAAREARYERIIDVLNALARARVGNVAFSAGEG